MTDPSECLECGVPIEILGTHELPGVDWDGGDALFTVWVIQCVMGHRYCQVDEDRTVKL